jgi:hypothetical protein
MSRGQPGIENSLEARHQWLTPVILATQEAEIRRITDSKPDPGK